MHEDNCAMLWKNQIRFPRQIPALQAEAQPKSVTCPPDSDFRLRVAASDPRHVVRTGFAVVDVQSALSEPAALQQATGAGPPEHTGHAFDHLSANGLDNVRNHRIAELPIRLSVGYDLGELVFVAE